MKETEEALRLKQTIGGTIPPWQKWGPYVAERSWGTVREDYSWNGDAWSFFPFEEANRKAYRWGEDGIAGWCDRYQTLVFAPVFWNGKDSILKERLFGLSSPEGNHGEDVKECYYHLDGLPTHAYMKYLYKYPHEAFPYEALKEKNRTRSTKEPEVELQDLGVFNEGNYFDIFIEYAKVDAEDVVIKVEAFNRGAKSAPLHLLLQLWFRNQWSWWDRPLPEPRITLVEENKGLLCLVADDTHLVPAVSLPLEYALGKRYLYGTLGGQPLFTDNETPSVDREYSKDAFHHAIIKGEKRTNPAHFGTKAGLHYFFDSVAPNSSVVIYARLTPKYLEKPLEECEALVAKRKAEADEFYQTIHPAQASEEERAIQRQAFAGMLWNKQFYYFDVNLWLKGDNSLYPPPPARAHIRNTHWRHLNSMRILSMPDKWEYCWFAAWDLAFHSLTFALIDIEFAKEQLWLLLFDQFQHPNGAIPAYEWEFSDLNPPIQAWAAYQLFTIQKEKTGVTDRAFLKKCFHKLIMNFAYWVNQVDSSGCNIFEGGFLGLDNITLIDRSLSSLTGAVLKQSDGTGWMALFSLNLMRIALELAVEDATYEGLATKFFQHFVYIAYAMHQRDDKSYQLWSEEDGFFYDVLVFPDGNFERFRVRSLVGLIPFFAIETISEQELERFPTFKRDFLWFLKNRKILTEECTFVQMVGSEKRYVFSLLNEERLKKILHYLWEPEEFHSPFGIRSLSKWHEKNPFYYKGEQIVYEPGESLHRMKGGNSNWRGPIWLPMNYLILFSLKKYASAYGTHLTAESTGKPPATLQELIHTLTEELLGLFKKNDQGMRPFWGEQFQFAKDPHFADHIQFFEYFHSETGKGLGASHQTGWTGLIANLIDEHFQI